LIRRKTLTSGEEFEFWDEIEVRGSQIWGKRVDVPTIHSADPLIFPLPKQFYGRVHCPDERSFFFFFLQTGPFLTHFFV
jgi:hypothetical protein